MSSPPRVICTEFLEDYRVKLSFSDGLAGSIDLQPILQGELFEPLRELSAFRQARVQHGTLVWPNEADLCPDVLHYWCEIGRVCSQDELDAAFVSPPRASAMTLNDKPSS
jgi:hypothetical protein